MIAAVSAPLVCFQQSDPLLALVPAPILELRQGQERRACSDYCYELREVEVRLVHRETAASAA